MMRVNLIGKANGAGLSRDLGLLAGALRACGCEVTVTPTGSRQSRQRKSWLRRCGRMLGLDRMRRRQAPSYDVNVMLEHVWSQYLADARFNVVVPNPEFFDGHDVAALSRIDKVWAKTVNTRRIFEATGCAVTLTGFDSEDRLDPACERRLTCFHLAGSSQLKGTRRLLEVWSRHPEWPQLVVVGRIRETIPASGNIKVLSGFVPDDQLKRLQNESVLHLCPSEAEGWGHYLVEAASTGAVVVTLAAPPMNELFTSERGLMMACHPGGAQRLAQRYVFDASALEAVMTKVLSMSEPELHELGNAARRWFVQNKAGFHERVKRALEELNV